MVRTKRKKLEDRLAGFSGGGRRRGGRDFTKEELEADRPPSWANGRMLGLWHRDKNILKRGGGPPRASSFPPIPLEVPSEIIAGVRDKLAKIGVPAPPCVQSTRFQNARDQYKHVEDSAFKRKFLKSISGNILDHVSGKRYCLLKRDPVLNEMYMKEENSKMSNPRVREMTNFRKKLPSWNKRNEVLAALEKHNVILITGETGCGKTTQIAQFILEDAIMNHRGSETCIMCTQPRRISAITVAERVASERGENLGGSVGYQIRLEKVMPRSTASILYCTTGVLLQYMHGDPLLTGVSNVIIDEIHERNTISDFVITLLKDISPLRPDLKIILMSATLNAERFSKYFNNCPTVHIPGFTFEVKEFYLEDVLEKVPFSYPISPGNKLKRAMKALHNEDNMFLEAFYRDLESKKYSPKVIENLRNPESNEINLKLIYELILHISTKESPGAILVFLPGWDKISALNKLMTHSGKFPLSRNRIIPLHSLMPTCNQKQVFARPPKGVRKIILATNIAETSITIDDVVYVIDCGKMKIKNFDVDGNVSTLKEEWVSLANAKQRRGRAGRVQEGLCFHMYSKGREMLLQKDMLPEILRTRLEEVILQGKILQVGKIGPFLQKVMDPPSEKAVELSIKLLTAMNALDSEEELTPLGFHLASLPIDPQAGKSLLFGAMFGILDPISSIAAALSFKDPFIIPLGQEREVDRIRQSFDAGHKSDHLILAKVIAQYEAAQDRNEGWEFANSNFMSGNVLDQLRQMKKQFASLLHDMKFASNSRVDSSENNQHSRNISVVRAVISSGLFPNIAVVRNCKRKRDQIITSMFTIDNQKVDFHPKSVFVSSDKFESRFLAYFEKLKSSKIFLYDCTMVFPLPLIFFCHDLKVYHMPDHKIIEAGENMKFRCSVELALLIVELRAWLDWLLEYKLCHPGITDWSQGSDEAIILNAVIELITAEEDMYKADDEKCFKSEEVDELSKIKDEEESSDDLSE